MGDITGLLLKWNEGDAQARDQLVTVAYAELRRMARRSLASEQKGHTLHPTALVGELYERLVDQTRVRWQNRAHFFGVVGQLMRRIVVDHARRRKRARRGGGAIPLQIVNPAERSTPPVYVDVLALDVALEELAGLDPQQAQIVELRFFGGLSVEEVAEVVGVSRATANRDWSMARTWLYERLGGA